jgi:primary-amine oxidase
MHPCLIAEESHKERRMMNFMRLFVFLGLLMFAWPVAAQEQQPEEAPLYHPMDALTHDEMQLAAQILRDAGVTDEKSQFSAMTLLEPPKDVVRAWTPDMVLPSRQAFAVFRRSNRTGVATIDLTEGKVLSVTDKPGTYPIVLDDSWTRGRDAFMKDARFLAALEKRELKNDGSVFCTPNSAGWFPGDKADGRNILKVPCFSQTEKLHPSLARPVEGLMGVVDSETGEVLQVFDGARVDLPPAPQGYGNTLKVRNAPVARVGFQQDGLGNLKLSGNLNVEWLNWSFHVRADKRAGMVVSLARFKDGARLRDVAYQMNVSEIFVPYMDPDPTWDYRAFMDAGEFGLGYLLSSLRPGVDCPDTAAFIDARLPNDLGGSYVRESGFCIFERPTGDPAWRHYSSGRKVIDGEPQLELVVRFIPTLGNYDYIVDFVFSPQGNIKLRVGATGFDAIKSVLAKDMESPTAQQDTQHGNLIAPYTVAPFHDHFFNFRLDLDADGTGNTLVQDSFVPQKIQTNSGRNSLWTLSSQRFLKEGPIDADHSTGGRTLRVVNAATKNSLKQNPSLWLNAHHDAQSILDPTDPPQQRAQFAANQFWLTRYKADELWAAGLLPNLNPKDEGLPQYVADGEDVAGQDVVVWYTMGFRHITRPEDFPILPTFWHEMTIRPAFFFDMDPSMTFNSGFRRD